MIAALLPVVAFELSEEQTHMHVLVLQVVLVEAKANVLQITQQDEEEFQCWVHGELTE